MKREYINSLYSLAEGIEEDLDDVKEAVVEKRELLNLVRDYYYELTGEVEKSAGKLHEFFVEFLNVDEGINELISKIARVLEHNHRDGFVIHRDHLIGVGDGVF